MYNENILLVVDMQNDFIDGALGSEIAKELVPKICEKIKAWDGRIIITQDTHHKNYLNTSEGRNLPISHCVQGTEGWEVNTMISNTLLLKSVEYDTYTKETFGCTDLALDLYDDYTFRQEDLNIEIVGLVLNICVISNALLIKSFLPEANISVDISCSEATSPEEREAAILMLKSCHIGIIGENS